MVAVGSAAVDASRRGRGVRRRSSGRGRRSRLDAAGRGSRSSWAGGGVAAVCVVALRDPGERIGVLLVAGRAPGEARRPGTASATSTSSSMPARTERERRTARVLQAGGARWRGEPFTGPRLARQVRGESPGWPPNAAVCRIYCTPRIIRAGNRRAVLGSPLGGRSAARPHAHAPPPIRSADSCAHRRAGHAGGAARHWADRAQRRRPAQPDHRQAVGRRRAQGPDRRRLPPDRHHHQRPAGCPGPAGGGPVDAEPARRRAARRADLADRRPRSPRRPREPAAGGDHRAVGQPRRQLRGRQARSRAR